MKHIKPWLWGVFVGLLYSLVPFTVSRLVEAESAEVYWTWALMNMHVWLLFGDNFGTSVAVMLVCVVNVLIGAAIFAGVAHLIKKR